MISVPHRPRLLYHDAKSRSSGAGLQTALQWLRRVLYQTHLTPELLKMAIKRHLALVPAATRNGAVVAGAIISHLEFDIESSNAAAAHALSQQPFLLSLEAQLATDKGAAAVVAAFHQLRTSLLRPQYMQLFFAADLRKLNSPYQTLAAAILPPATEASGVAAAGEMAVGGPVTGAASSNIRSGKSGQAVVMSLSAIESNFLTAAAPGIGAYSPDHASLLVAIEYLTALEGAH